MKGKDHGSAGNDMESFLASAEFYKGKTIFLTGHTGFKGGWLAKILSMLGSRVIGYSLEPDTKPNLFQAAEIKTAVQKNYFDDVRNLTKLKKAIEETNPDIVFHLAAQSLVRRSYEDPLTTYHTNVLGTVNILEALRFNSHTRAAIMITTDKVYENIERQHGYKEDDRLGGHDPYSSSKACAELAISAYRRSFFAKSNCKIASARAGNVIGGGDWAKDRLIPDLIRSIYENKKLELRYPNAIRPWQHVLDVCNGYLILAEKLYENRKYEGAYNFAPLSGKSFTVEEIVKMGIGVVGKGKYSISSGSEPSEASILRLDATKAKRLLGWRPKLKIKKALKLTFDWYASFYERNEGREEMEKQIKDYFFIQ